jgi:biopolymer transport protein ExbD
MAGIDVGSSSTRRETNRELALVPFIDFLLCLVAFLLVTAVWTKMSRLPADASVPGKPECCTPPTKPKTLHVTVEDARFVLSWREGNQVLTRNEIARHAVRAASGDARFPELSRAIEQEWRANGQHRAASDRTLDSAVLHTPNSLPYADVVAVMDAIRHVRRSDPALASGREPASGRTEPTLGGRGEPAFAVSFAVD